jgi:hypothetical protein
VVVAMAAGLASVGAAIPTKEADANGAAEAVAPRVVDAEVAQPDSNALMDMAPKGSMGAVTISLRAERRDDRLAFDMVGDPRVLIERNRIHRKD